MADKPTQAPPSIAQLNWASKEILGDGAGGPMPAAKPGERDIGMETLKALVGPDERKPSTVWKDREDAGRAAREGASATQTQGHTAKETHSGVTSGHRQRQSIGD